MNLKGVVEIGATALAEAAKGAEVIVIDEIGPMELTSPEFKRSAEACFRSGRPILAVVHDKIKDPLIELIRALPDKEMIELTLHNREGLPESLADQIGSRPPSPVGPRRKRVREPRWSPMLSGALMKRAGARFWGPWSWPASLPMRPL